MDKTSGRALWRGQLTARGVVIGCIGCVVITASSAYTALKLGALPWPIVFAAIVSLFFLKLLGNASLNEANVTHTIMSAGAMVAGGLAFTIPGAWMLGYADEVGFAQMLIVALAGTGLGLVATAIIHRHFIVDTDLEFPMGASAAQTLRATEAGGKTGRRLFASMGLAGAYAVLRDGLGAVPAMLAALPIPGVSFGIYNSPMMVSVGFLVGGVAVAWWFAGALLANFGIVVAGSAAGLWSVDAAQGIVKSLGMGLMMGAGLAVVAKDILPQLAGIARGVQGAGSNGGEDAAESLVSGNVRTDAGTFAVVAAAIVVLMCMGLGLPPVVSIVVVLLAFVTTAMSAQSCGQTGIDPMEIFGLIVLLLVSAFAQIREVQLFFIAGVVAVACGLAGDVMNDFKAGSILGTDPRAQWRRAGCRDLGRRHDGAGQRLRARRIWAGEGFRLGAGKRRGDDGLGDSQRSRVCDWSCSRCRPLLGGTSGNDAGAWRLPALLHVFHGDAWRGAQVGDRSGTRRSYSGASRGRALRTRRRRAGGRRGNRLWRTGRRVDCGRDHCHGERHRGACRVTPAA